MTHAKTNPMPLPTLPMHLMLTVGCWLSSPFALQCAKSGLLPLSSLPNLLQKSPAAQLPKKLEQAINAEAKSRAASLLSGVLRYFETPYVRDVAEPPCVWQRGSARLLDYGSLAADNASLSRVVLFIPSLINRYYILDLEEERSMLRHLITQGIYPLVLDWGQPGDDEAGFSCADYVSEVLAPAIDFISKFAGEKIHLAGYCMGGVLALAAAQVKPQKVASLALFATPWDFHCEDFEHFLVDAARRDWLLEYIRSHKTLSPDFVQSLFYIANPWLFEQKFRRYEGLAEGSRAARDFVALEHWVNDGVPMTAKVAEDCLIDWAQDNHLLAGKWKVKNKSVRPEKMTLPTFMAIPQNDHVVPLSCALPLADALPHAHIIRPSAGHVGMMVGSRAKRELWQPYADWLIERRET
ncbi:MAG: alpha/beta fold hydrolase [Alphaproteobacteria bacterium]|nr:alpha/beta fold hydrolase [Alphaproteobacteria bacterium]